MTRPRASVIIPVHNDLDGLHACLAALRAQTVPTAEYEVVCIDNNSDPPVADSDLQHPSARLVRETRKGSYAARNAGIRCSTGPVLAFTDADCRPDPEWLANALSHRADQHDVFLAGAVRLYPLDPARPTGAELYEMAYGFPQETYVRDFHFGVTANLIVSRKCMERVGVFDERLRSGGDKEWGQRAWDKGVRGVYAPDVAVRHPARRRLRDLYAKRRRTAEGNIQLARMRGEPAPSAAKAYWSAFRPPVREVANLRRRLGKLSLGQSLRLMSAITFVRLASFLEISRALSEERRRA